MVLFSLGSNGHSFGMTPTLNGCWCMTGYIYSSGVSELVVGICMGLAGATGIVGTVIFTRLRRRLGLVRTGLIALSAQLSCLSLAVVSVWTPGSPFDIHYTATDAAAADTESPHSVNMTVMTTYSSHTDSTQTPQSHAAVNVSIILLLVGIISSRIGKHCGHCRRFTRTFVRPVRVTLNINQSISYLQASLMDHLHISYSSSTL